MTAFGDAFKTARAAGKTTFTWNGKKYHTKTKEEMERARAKSGADTKRSEPAARQPIDSMAKGSDDRPVSRQSETPSMRGTMFDQALAASSGSRSSSSRTTSSLSIPERRGDNNTPSDARPHRAVKHGDQWVLVGGPTIGERIGGSIYSARKALGNPMRYKGKRK